MNAGHATIIDCHDKNSVKNFRRLGNLFFEPFSSLSISALGLFYAVKIVSARVRHYEPIKPSKERTRCKSGFVMATTISEQQQRRSSFI